MQAPGPFKQEAPRPVTHVLTIGAKNCVDVLGISFVKAKRLAAAEGVPLLRIGPRKVLIPAAPLLAALERHAVVQRAPDPEPGSPAELDAMRARLGLRRIGGAS